jgi:hypothetical protein
MRQRTTGPVPQGMRVQLARLFGADSRCARAERQTSAQWRHTLLRVLQELDRYVAANIVTDQLHMLMLHSGLYAAHESLNEEDFWPGYAEGITRVALVLMGDYPDHRRRKKGRKQGDHYSLSRERSVRYVQTWSQKLSTLVAAKPMGLNLRTPPYDALREFRRQYGDKPGYDEFFKWYRLKHPQDYAVVF